MAGFGTLLKKEFVEQLRTHKLLIVGSIFIFFGITTPLLLKYLPEILRLSGETMQIEIPPPTGSQSLVEFASTIGQVGIVVAVLLGMGAVSNEYRHGTAVIILSKPVTRIAFVMSKLIAMSSTFLLSLAIAALFCYFYTIELIGKASDLAFLQSNLLLGLFLVFCLATTVLFSCLFKSSLAAGGLAIAVIISQAAISSMPLIGDYIPGKLLGWGAGLITGSGDQYWSALGITMGLIVLAVYLSQHILKLREI